MNIERILQSAKRIQENPSLPLLQVSSDDESGAVASFINELLAENRSLRQNNETAFHYIRQKINQLLLVIGTIPLRPEELDDATLIHLDPISIIAESFIQILDHQRETNDQLELAMDEIQAIFESMGGGILVLDSSKNIVSYNQKLRRMFDIKEKQICGLSCSDILCKGTPPGQCPFEEMLKTGTTVSMSVGCPKNARHYNIVTTPIKDKDGTIIRAIMLYVDITDLIEAKEAVANEKERLALTLESIAEGVMATDSNGAITLMNSVAEELTGWSLDEAMGKPVCQILTLQKENKPSSCTDIFNDILKNNSTLKRIHQTVLMARDGQKMVITLSAAPIRREEQYLATGSILVFRDISQEINMEMEVLRSKRIESLGIVAGGIAHDFNNLLTAILGNISLAKIMASDNNAIAALLTESENASFRAKDLTRQLLTFAKGGAPVATLTSIRQLIEESAQFSSRGSNIKCHFYIPDDLWHVEVDAGQIGQVIQNLVINADQAMHQGGIVEIGAENIIINKDEKSPLKPGKYIKIYVKDMGQGMESQCLDKIFDPYFTTKKTGHGLGLSICYPIMKKHDGLINVESQPGVGSTFSLYLPAAADQQLPAQSEGELLTEITETIPVRQKKLLVMDDEEIIREVASQMLGYLGYNVEVAIDGQQTLTMYRQAVEQQEPFDAVIMDLTIPGGMGGKEAIEYLLLIDPEVKVIVSSGYANDPIMADFKRYGFQGVMPKPFSMKELSTALKQVLHG